MKISESKIGQELQLYLQDMHWEVYPEVIFDGFGWTADIVAKQGKLLWVLEIKTTASIAVIEQAHRWRFYAHYISVVTPPAKSKMFGHILRQFGIGHLTYSLDSFWEDVQPRLNRKISKLLYNSLHEDQKVCIPGSVSGHVQTPFKRTKGRILEYVKANPGCTLKDIINNVETHYNSTATAKSAIPHWIKEGLIPIRVDNKQKPYKYYYQE